MNVKKLLEEKKEKIKKESSQHIIEINGKNFPIKMSELGVEQFRMKLLEEFFEWDSVNELIPLLREKVTTFDGRIFLRENNKIGSFVLEKDNECFIY